MLSNAGNFMTKYSISIHSGYVSDMPSFCLNSEGFSLQCRCFSSSEKKEAGELFLKNSERNFGLFDLKLLNVKRKRE